MLESITVFLTGNTKNMRITTKAGREFTATMNFPRVLKKEDDTGLADSRISIEGIRPDSGKTGSFTLDLNMVKTIRITDIQQK